MVKVKGSLILDSQTSEPSNPVEGEIYYNSNNKNVQVYNGSVFNNLSSLAAKGVAQNAYQTLKHSGTFDNKDNLGADRFTDESGVNNTVNTGSSSAKFKGSKYELGAGSYPGDGSNNTASQTGSQDVSSGQTSPRGIGGVCLQSCYLKSYKIFSGVSGATRFRIMDGSNSQIYTETFSGTGIKTLATPFLLEAGNTYYFVVDDNGGSYTLTRDIAPDFSDSIDFDLNSGYENSPNQEAGNIENIVTETALSSLNSILVCDSNLQTLIGDESGLCVYADKVNTANTNITYNVSDGTTTISDLEFNTVNRIASLGSGQLTITFNLSTTNTSETPELYGYGVYID